MIPKKNMVTALPSNDNAVWYEVRSYLKRVFEKLPKKSRELYEVSANKLISDLSKEFKGKYNAQEVAKLLSNGFEVEPGLYRFKYADFKEIKTPVVYNPVKLGK